MHAQPPRFVKPGVAERQLGVDRRTLQKWAESGVLRSVQPGGPGRERLYDVAGFGVATSSAATTEPALGAGEGTAAHRVVDAVYARVSTRKQRDDLDTQLATLTRRHPDARVFSDVGSGLKFKRKGLLSLLELAFEGRLRSVHVAHKDRLCRFAFDLLEHVFRRHGAQVVVDAHGGDAASPELELAEDVLAVVTVFGARLYGRRSGGNRRCRAKRKRGEDGGATAQAGAQDDGQDGDGLAGTATARATANDAPNDRLDSTSGSDADEAQGDAGPAPAGLGWAAADLQGAHGLDSGSEADAEGLLCGSAVGVQ